MIIPLLTISSHTSLPTHHWKQTSCRTNDNGHWWSSTYYPFRRREKEDPLKVLWRVSTRDHQEKQVSFSKSGWTRMTYAIQKSFRLFHPARNLWLRATPMQNAISDSQTNVSLEIGLTERGLEDIGDMTLMKASVERKAPIKKDDKVLCEMGRSFNHQRRRTVSYRLGNILGKDSNWVSYFGGCRWHPYCPSDAEHRRGYCVVQNDKHR